MFTLRLTPDDLEKDPEIDAFVEQAAKRWIVGSVVPSLGLEALYTNTQGGKQINGKRLGLKLNPQDNSFSDCIASFKTELSHEFSQENINKIDRYYSPHLTNSLLSVPMLRINNESRGQILLTTSSGDTYYNLYEESGCVFHATEYQFSLRIVARDGGNIIRHDIGRTLQLNCVWKITHVLTEKGFKLFDIQLTNPLFKGLILNISETYAFCVAACYINDCFFQLKAELFAALGPDSPLPVHLSALEQIFSEILEILQNPLNALYFKLLDKLDKLQTTVEKIVQEKNSEPGQNRANLDLLLAKISEAHVQTLWYITHQPGMKDFDTFTKSGLRYCVQQKKHARLSEFIQMINPPAYVFKLFEQEIASPVIGSDLIPRLHAAVICELAEPGRGRVSIFKLFDAVIQKLVSSDPKSSGGKTYSKLLEDLLEEYRAFDYPRALLFEASYYQATGEWEEARRVYLTVLELPEIPNEVKETADLEMVELYVNGYIESDHQLLQQGIATQAIPKIKATDGNEVPEQKTKEKETILRNRSLPAYPHAAAHKSSDKGAEALSRLHNMLAGYDGVSFRNKNPDWNSESIKLFGDLYCSHETTVKVDLSEYILQASREAKRESLNAELPENTTPLVRKLGA